MSDRALERGSEEQRPRLCMLAVLFPDQPPKSGVDFVLVPLLRHHRQLWEPRQLTLLVIPHSAALPGAGQYGPYGEKPATLGLLLGCLGNIWGMPARI